MLLPQGKPSYRGSVAISFPYFLDWLTTWGLVTLGGHEANPYLREFTLAEMLLLKLGTLPFILTLTKFSYQINRRFGFAILTGLVVWFSGLTIWNTYLMVQT